MRPIILIACLAVSTLPTNSFGEITLAHLLEAGRSNTVAVQGNYVFGGLGSHLLSIDVSDPVDPARVGSMLLAGNVYDIVVSGTVAYVGTGNNFSILDISNPTAPLLLGLESGSGARGVALSGTVAFITAGKGVRSIDVSNPAQPVAMGSTTLSGYPYGIRIAGSHAFAAGFLSSVGLLVIDVSNPFLPTQVGFLSIPGGCYDLDIVGQYAYVPYSNGLRIVDIGDPSSPTQAGNYSSPGVYGFCVVVVDSYAYVLGSYGQLDVVDVSNPTQPVGVTNDAYLGGMDVAHAGGRLYVADTESSFRVVDVSNPADPTATGTHHALLSPHTVALQNGSMYVGEDWRITTVAVADPFAPEWITSFYSYGPNTALKPHGATLFAGRHATIFDGGDGGLTVFDVSQPSMPQELSLKFGFDGVYDLHADGSYVYQLGAPRSGQTTFVTYDVANLAAPVQISSVNVPFLSPNFDMSGNLVLVACLANDLKIYDVTNHAQPPVMVSTFTGTTDARDVVCIGGHAFVADGSEGLIVVDFSNPTNPVEVGRLAGIGQPRYIAAAYPYVVIVGSDPLLRIVNISDPSEPFVADSYSTGGSSEIAIEGSTIATVVGFEGVLLLDAPILTTPTNIGAPTIRAALNVYPNPFNPRTTVSFSLPMATHVVLDVFDTAGRHVRALTNGPFREGSHRVTWDGHDSAGNPCASGVYFARMRAGTETVNRKLVLLK